MFLIMGIMEQLLLKYRCNGRHITYDGMTYVVLVIGVFIGLMTENQSTLFFVFALGMYLIHGWSISNIL